MSEVSITRRRVLGVLDTMMPVLEREACETGDPEDQAALRACGALRGDIATGVQVDLRRVRHVIDGSLNTLARAGNVCILYNQVRRAADRAYDIADDLLGAIADLEELRAEEAA